MMWLFNLVIALLPAGIKAYFGVKQDQAVQSGVNQEKANEGSTVIAEASDAQIIRSDVDRMSDDSVRNSPYANNRN